jgi:hypothetical protein
MIQMLVVGENTQVAHPHHVLAQDRVTRRERFVLRYGIIVSLLHHCYGMLVLVTNALDAGGLVSFVVSQQSHGSGELLF